MRLSAAHPSFDDRRAREPPAEALVPPDAGRPYLVRHGPGRAAAAITCGVTVPEGSSHVALTSMTAGRSGLGPPTRPKLAA